MPELIDDILKIKESFSSAEKYVKDCETLAGELPQGAVNELRYAASHFLDYLETGYKENLEKYYRHCKRAKYDSQELPILMIKGKIDIYLERFKGDEDAVSAIMGDKYEKILDSRDDINKLILSANEAKDSRQEYLEEIQKALPVIQADLKSIEKLTPAIEAKIKKDKRFWYVAVAGLIFTILGVLIGKFL